MKGIILSGGNGTRLYPLTLGISKQLLPVYDKPLIYYSLSVLMLAGLREILVITTERDLPLLQSLLGDGSQWGISLSYIIQHNPDGLSHAFILAEDFLNGDSACLILGDNIFYGQGFVHLLEKSRHIIETKNGACIFGYHVNDPKRYGIVNFDNNGHAISLEEKPEHPKSHYAVTGLYFYDNSVVNLAKKLTPSKRGELEITDLNQLYLEKNKLHVQLLGRGYAWLDAGTHKSLLDSSEYVATIEKRQGLKIACLEEIAWRKKYITTTQLLERAKFFEKTDYGKYILDIIKPKIKSCINELSTI